MATDATDKLLVASVLERGKRDMDGDVVQPEQEDVIGAPRNFGAAGELGVQVTVEESPEAAVAGAAGQARRGRGRQAPDPGRARGHGPGHGRHRRPRPHVPQGDRQGPPPQRRGRGRLRQGHRARRADRRGAVEGHALAPGVDQERHRARLHARSGPSTGSTTSRPTPQRIVRGAIRGRREGRPARAVARPPPDRRPACGQPRSTQGLLKEAKKLAGRLQRGARLRSKFVALVDFSYMAVHNGDQDCRDNKGLRALYDWTRGHRPRVPAPLHPRAARKPRSWTPGAATRR